jgi:hypothetical protein
LILIRIVSVCALILECDLASLLFFDLFEGLKEELLDVTPLIEDHLAEGLQVLQLTRLQSDTLSQPADVLTLLFDDLLTLKTQEFFFFFEIRNNFTQSLL